MSNDLVLGQRLYKPSQGFFDELAALVVGLASFNAATSAFTSWPAPPVPFNENHEIVLTGRVAHARLPIVRLMRGVAGNVWPAEIPIDLQPAINPIPSSNGVQLQHDAITNMVTQLVGTAFLRYYERNVDRPRAAFEGHPRTWPALWRFAWLLRNAIAHSDSWSINDATLPATNWRGIEVKASDTGLSWFDHSRFLGGGDVFLLLEELDASPI